MIVMKFGGTSVGSADSIRRTVRIVKAGLPRKPLVVVSALSGVTDMLLAAAEDALKRSLPAGDLVKKIRDRHTAVLLGLGLGPGLVDAEFAELEHVLFGVSLVRELTLRTSDYVASFGERMSSTIVAAFAKASGLNLQAFNACELGMLTNAAFGSAEILPETYASIAGAVGRIPGGVVPVVTGFIGKTAEGEVTTLGRGGSDYTASIFGAALGAEEIQIWTDVDGVMTADPRIVPDARTVAVVSFEEASELAYFGAKVLHPKTIIPAMEKEIPVRVLNTFNPAGKGTLIVRKAVKSNPVTAITSKKDIFVINIHSARMLMVYGFLNNVFRIFNDFKVPVDMVATSEVNVTVTVDKQFDVSGIVARLGEFSEVDVLSDRASISIVGEGIRSTAGVGGRIFSILGSRGINVEMTSQSYGDVNESIIVMAGRLNEAVQALHAVFFGDDAGKVAAAGA